jgi:ribonuclease Z
MRPSFLPRLVNGPFEDPGLFISMAHSRRAILFDLGDLSALSPGDILKISHVFVSHTHMDHFIGFDQLLRLMLGRDRALVLFGPKGFLGNVAGKLSAYTWNLVHNYDEGLVITAVEIREGLRLTQRFACRHGFKPSAVEEARQASSTLLDEPGLQIKVALLDHQIPSLAFAIQERFHVNILKPALEALDLKAGPWLNRFKDLLFRQADPATEIKAPLHGGPGSHRTFTLKQLSDKISRITAGQKVAYVADAVYNRTNADKIVSLAKSADRLYIEAAFSETERHTAQSKWHLTAHQAGLLAQKANVGEVTIFHHSPRYRGREAQLKRETEKAFRGP